MSVLREDLHSQAQREAARNRRADSIMAWAVGVACLLTLFGILTGAL